MKCKYCQAEIEKDSLFCTNCGKDLSKLPKCVKCGEILDDHSEFCPYCGTQQPREEPVQQEEVQVPKKSKKWIWVLCVIAILLLLTGGGAFYYFNMVGTADENIVAQDSISVTETKEMAVKENLFKEIVRNGDWVKADDGYKEMFIHVDWPVNLLIGDVIPLQDKLFAEGFGFNRCPIEDAVSKYISTVGTPVEKPALSDDDRDYNGCDLLNLYLEIRKVAYKEGNFITFSIFKHESLKFASSILYGDFNYYTYDLKENRFLNIHDIIQYSRKSEVLEIVKKKFTEDDISLLTWDDPSAIDNLDFTNDVYVADREIVFTFTGHHNYEIKVLMYYKEIYDFLTDRIKEYFKDYN